MKRQEKMALWVRGAKHALRELRAVGGDMQANAARLLEVPDMKRPLRDDYWARGFVAMLKKKAKWEDPFFLPGQNQGGMQ